MLWKKTVSPAKSFKKQKSSPQKINADSMSGPVKV